MSNDAHPVVCEQFAIHAYYHQTNCHNKTLSATDTSGFDNM